MNTFLTAEQVRLEGTRCQPPGGRAGSAWQGLTLTSDLQGGTVAETDGSVIPETHPAQMFSILITPFLKMWGNSVV